MYNIKHITLIAIAAVFITACKQAKTKDKPISDNIAKTAVTVNGKKDSVDNNTEKNYTNATVSEPCVRCLLGVIQKTDSYKKMTATIAPQNIIYDVNWITSKTPKNMGNDKQIVNGMMININQKSSGQQKNITTYLYNNQNAQFFVQNSAKMYILDAKVDSISLKTIRRKCFWGVASAK